MLMHTIYSHEEEEKSNNPVKVELVTTILVRTKILLLWYYIEPSAGDTHMLDEKALTTALGKNSMSLS